MGEPYRDGIIARHASICPVCQGPISPGDRTYLTLRSTWVCANCQTSGAAKARYAPGATRDAPGYSRPCPTCGVEVGELCLTSSGKKRALHPARR